MSDVAPVTVAADTTVPAVVLPNWTDAGSITSFVTSIATFVVGLLTMTGVVLPSGTHTAVTAWAGIAGVAIAAGVQIVNFVRITVLHKSAVTAGHTVAVKVSKPTTTNVIN